MINNPFSSRSLSQDSGDSKRCVGQKILIYLIHPLSVLQIIGQCWHRTLNKFCVSCSQVKSDTGKKQDVMTLSDSDDVQTISSGSEDNKEREKSTPGNKKSHLNLHLTESSHFYIFDCFNSLFISCPVCWRCCFGSGVTKKQVAVKSTRGIALKAGHGMMVKTGAPGGGGGPGGQGGKTGQQGHTGGVGDNAPKNTRLFFDGEESCYIIDAKLEGNLGRYLNVSIHHVCVFFRSQPLSLKVWLLCKI